MSTQYYTVVVARDLLNKANIWPAEMTQIQEMAAKGYLFALQFDPQTNKLNDRCDPENPQAPTIPAVQITTANKDAVVDIYMTQGVIHRPASEGAAYIRFSTASDGIVTYDYYKDGKLIAPPMADRTAQRPAIAIIPRHPRVLQLVD